MIMTGTSRRWSGTMGQHNILRFRAGQVDPMSRRLGKLFKMLGLKEWWDRRYYSCTILVPENVMKRAQGVRKRVKRDDINTMGLLRHKWGEGVLDDNKKYRELFEELKKWYGVDFHESIITWHITTDLIIASWEERDKGHYAEYQEELSRVDTVRALSNYMMFLLVNRPYMLPGLPQNWLYKQTCNNLDTMIYHGNKLSSPRVRFRTVLEKIIRPHRYWDLKPSVPEKELAHLILKPQHHGTTDYSENPRLSYAQNIARIVIESDVNEVKLLQRLWTDFLAYAANRCSRESHARKLSSGGELTTIVWLVLEHLRRIKE
jgi:hypothetical protein